MPLREAAERTPSMHQTNKMPLREAAEQTPSMPRSETTAVVAHAHQAARMPLSEAAAGKELLAHWWRAVWSFGRRRERLRAKAPL